MQCPNCGFQQPQDEYCAQCGVSIAQAQSRRQRRHWFALLSTFILLVVAGLYLYSWLSNGTKSPSPQSVSPESSSSLDDAKAPPSPTELPASPGEAAALKEPLEPADESAVSSPAEPRPESLDQTGESDAIQVPESLPSPMLEPSPESPGNAALELDPEHEIRRLAAQEWFDKGQKLADYSEEELRFYKKALNIDPNFALAHYCAGLIYWEWGDRKAAIEGFRQFWQYATEEEREIYLLPVEINQEDLVLPTEAQ